MQSVFQPLNILVCKIHTLEQFEQFSRYWLGPYLKKEKKTKNETYMLAVNASKSLVGAVFT